MLLVLFLLAMCKSIIECVDFNSIPGGDVRGFTRSDAVRPDGGGCSSSCGRGRGLPACEEESGVCASMPVARRCGGDLVFEFGVSLFAVVLEPVWLTESILPSAKALVVGGGKD